MLHQIVDVLNHFYYPVLVIAALYFFLLSLANHYEMWRFTLGPEIFDGPLVSVLVPARNEEQNIEKCINSLRHQVYKNFEVLILDDNSTDGTLAIIQRIAASDRKVRIYKGKPLPSDWYGKPYALHQLSQHAKGEILILTDADTVHGPTSISWAVTNLLGLKADMISGYIGQIIGTFGERITVPLMYFLTGFIIPLFLNRFAKKLSVFSAACGQYIAIRTTVFNAIGGCETFKKKTSEDVYMSRYVKRMGYSTRFLNISEQVKCRMYNGLHAAIEGIGKNIFDFFGKKTILLILMIIVVFFLLFFPFPLFFICLFTGSPWTLHIAFVVAAYTLTWLFMFLGQKINWWYCFLWPLMFLVLLYMAIWSYFRTISGLGFLWKDRVVE